MNTLAQSHYSAALTGAPPGYVGSKEGHTLLNAELIAGSYSCPGIVLFDELEKASDEVIRSLLNVMDNGQLVLSAGQRTIDFRNALIFMTSNTGVKELIQQREHWTYRWRHWRNADTAQQQAIITRALEKRFDPEFINRIDRILHYRTIDGMELQSLLDVEIHRLNERLQKTSATITLDESAKAFLMAFYDPRYGARDVARHVRRELEPRLAQCLFTHPQAQQFIGTIDKGKLAIFPA